MEITYQLTKKQNFFRENINTFVKQAISPGAAEIDGHSEFPRQVMDRLAGNRLLGLLVPGDEGGEGAGFLDLCLVLEGIARMCPTSALICSVQNLGARLLSKTGTTAQKERRLEDLMAGKAIFGYAMPDAASLKLTQVSLSVSKENDTFILNGPECSVVNGDVADLVCMFAAEEDAIHGFLVEDAADLLKATRPVGTAGAEARATCGANLENISIPADFLLREAGKGKDILAEFISEAACFTAARALGIAQGALDLAIEYSGQREQFGRPIGKFQAIQVLLADMAIHVEAARHLVYKTASVLDEGSNERFRFSSMAKYFATKIAMKTATDAVQVAGGYGYTRDYPLEKMMRNAQLTQIMDGSSHAHQLAGGMK